MNGEQGRVIYFYRQGDDYYEFSNFWSIKDHQKKYKRSLKLLIDDKLWRSTEAFYQAQTFSSCQEYQEIFRGADTPGKVYKLGQKRLLDINGNFQKAIPGLSTISSLNIAI